MPGRLSAVVVHHSGRADLERCVRSLRAQDWPDLEIVVIDNGATDGAPALLDGPVRRVWLPRNAGFAAGANAGLAAATGELLLLLNPDAAVLPGCLRALAAAGSDVAVPRVLLDEQPELLDNCGHLVFPDGLNWCRGRGLPAAGRFERPEDLLLFSGAAVLFRRAALARSGLFDPSYFAFGEDADLSLRASARGLGCRYVPEATVRHRVGGSFGKLALRKVFLVERNRARVAITHLPLAWLVAAPAWTAARLLVMARGALAGEGLAASWPPSQRPAVAAVVLAAWLASIPQIPGSLARRRAVGGRPPRDRLRLARATLADLAARPKGC